MHLILDINQRTIIELYLNINYNILILNTHNRAPPLREPHTDAHGHRADGEELRNKLFLCIVGME